MVILACAWLPFLLAAWDQAKPAGGDALRDSDDAIRANNTALESAIGQDHEFSTLGTNSGKHIQVTFDANLAAAPTTVAADEGVLYLLDVSSKAELHFEDEDENTLQLTSAGDLYSSTNLSVAGTSTLTGAVAVGGTLDVTGNIDPTSYETTNGGFLDEDTMSSDSATAIASQQSIKKYVDDGAYKATDGSITTGYRYCDVQGSLTQVFTKYLTGTTAAASSTSVAHNLTAANILSVSLIIYDGSVYRVCGYRESADTQTGFRISYDATNLIISLTDTQMQSKAYRIKVDYTI